MVVRAHFVDGPIKYYREIIETEDEEMDSEQDAKLDEVPDVNYVGISPLYSFTKVKNAGSITIRDVKYDVITQWLKFDPDRAFVAADSTGILLYSTQRRTLNGEHPVEGGNLLQGGLKLDNRTLVLILTAAVRGNLFPISIVPIIQ